MIKIASIVGARPQILKAAAFSRALREKHTNQIEEYIIHSGQHYDHTLSAVFFKELGIPQPHFNLNVGSGSHGVQTTIMLEKFESVFQEIHPDAVVVYGDTNSTLAAALAAAKIHIPVVHIEAGLRSFNKLMPEEINRITTDHCSTLLFSPTRTGIENLKHEGFNEQNVAPYHINNPGVFHCGDIMLDNSLHYASIAAEKSKILKTYNLSKDHFILATIHRDYNTDNPVRLIALLKSIVIIAKEIPVIIPLHPRAKKEIQALDHPIKDSFFHHPAIQITAPLSFFDMIVLEKNSKMIMTDSGGVQKEAYFFQRPVIILRSETEWTEIVENGCGIITGSNEDAIINAYQHYRDIGILEYPPVFGDGKAAEFMCNTILQHIEGKQ